jgi:quercetin dioxygenase-like cupin family protein
MDWFTGAVRIDPLCLAPDPARVSGAHVTSEPGARTAWHTHPPGQTSRPGSDGCSARTVRSRRSVLGGVVWFPPGLKHWHGVTASKAISHIAIQESLNERPATWMEHVSEEQYSK